MMRIKFIIKNKKNRSSLEDLPNEIIYEIFQYIDVYHIYYSFFYLNNRFRNLVENSNFPIQIFIPNITKTNFELYIKNFILPNRYRINVLHLSNPFTIDEIFSPPSLIYQFIQLEKIIFDHIDSKYLKNIFRYLTMLTKLHSLKISLADSISKPSFLFILIFRLSYLKTCHLTYQLKTSKQPLPIDLTEYRQSSIENLTINTRFPFNSLTDLFTCLPNLHYLSIDYLIGSNLVYLDLSSIVLKHLKYVSIKLDNIRFDTLEKLTNYYFQSVEIFYISIQSTDIYIPPKRWKELIKNLMPNLRIFDLNYIDNIQQNKALFYFFHLEFHDSFWKTKKWYFTHQHDYRNNKNHAILYSINPYRRKAFTYHWSSSNDDHNYYRNGQVENYNSVECLEVYVTKPKYFNKYFPNVIELTIGNYFKTFDIMLNRILPLKQLKILYIKDYQFPFEDIIQLLYSTSNLHTLKLDFLFIFQLNISLLEKNEIYQYVKKNNQIKYFHLFQSCTLELLKFILQLFPQIEYLEIGMVTVQIHEILRYLFSTTHQIRSIRFLQTPKKYLKELNVFMKTEKLIENYSMKLLNRHLYLWW